MSLKQIIIREKIMQATANNELTLPEEPMIYSVKYKIGSRTKFANTFRNMKWKSIFKCVFPSFLKTTIPVVLIVRFYVKPPESESIPIKQLRTETLPATFSFELCDYLLSFMEMLNHVLINSYKQIVKVDMIKLYSDNPRTTFKLMRYDHYVKLQNNDPIHSKTKTINSSSKKPNVQSKRTGNATDKAVRKAKPAKS